MIFRWRPALVFCLSAFILASVGCGRGDLPALGQVRGKVTLDGKPLAGALISFYPQAGGRTAVATLDSEGKYELTYTYGVKGTKVGVNLVNLAWPDDAPKAAPIPEKYGAKSELKADVKAGKNTFDFTLESKK